MKKGKIKHVISRLQEKETEIRAMLKLVEILEDELDDLEDKLHELAKELESLVEEG